MPFSDTISKNGLEPKLIKIALRDELHSIPHHLLKHLRLTQHETSAIGLATQRIRNKICLARVVVDAQIIILYQLKPPPLSHDTIFYLLDASDECIPIQNADWKSLDKIHPMLRGEFFSKS